MIASLPSIADKKTIVIGAANTDITTRFHEPVEHIADSNSGTVAQHDGGVARNIAEVLGRLGMPTSILSAFGDCNLSQQMQAHLQKHNIDISTSVICENMRSDVFISIHDHHGELFTAINQMSNVNNITSAYILTKADYIKAADYVICDCNLSEDVLLTIAQMPRNGLLIIDGVSTSKIRRIANLLPYIDLLKISRIESETLCNAPAHLTAHALLKQICDKGVRQVLLSDGANGFFINEGASIHHVEAIESTAETVTGAGDCLLAGYIFGIASQLSVIEACDIARKTAFLSTKSVAPVNDSITVTNILHADNGKPRL